MEDKTSVKVYVMATLAVIFWGASFAGAKVAVGQASPLLVLFLRFAMSFIVLIPMAMSSGEMRMPTVKQAAVLAFMAFMGFFFHMGIQTIAMETSGSANANWQMAASPAIGAILAGIFLKEKVSKKGLLGIVISFIGVAIVLGFGTKGAQGFSSYNFGDFLMSISSLNWAAFMVLTRWMFKGDDYPPVFTILWETFFATLMCIPAMVVVHTDISVIASFRWQTWAALVQLGLLCSGLAYAFWYIAAAHIPVAQLMVFQFIQPFIGVVAAYFMVGERFTPWLLLGGVVTVLGVSIVNRQHK